MKDLKDGIRSKVRIDFEGKVHKWFRGTDKEKRCENEVRILRALEERGCPYVPRVLDYDPAESYIVTSNCGHPAPDISRTKSDALFAELESEYGVRHNDPEPRNVTYSPAMGRFCLIDFELAELLEAPTQPPRPHTKVWRVSWAALSSQGANHRANDDAFLALEIGPDGPRSHDDEGEFLLDPAHLILAVSDGMGGGKAGEFGSRLILSWVRKVSSELYSVLRTSKDAGPLADILRGAHRGLNALAAQDPALEGTAATVTLAWITPGRLHLAQLGDSRLYLFRPSTGACTQLSHEHTQAWCRWQRGEISEFQYRTHPRRNILYDVLGGGHSSINPQTASFPIEDGDRLLLCTDGINEGLWERHIQEHLSEGEPPSQTAHKLLTRAREADQRDDATLIVADLSLL